MRTQDNAHFDAIICFSQPKVFLVGHSWGSILGIITIKKHPEDYYAYVGIGQVVNAKKNLQLSYDTINKLAEQKENKKEITKFAQFDFSRNINGDILLKPIEIINIV